MGRLSVFTLLRLLRRYGFGAGALLSLLLMGSLTWSAGGVILPGDINGDGVVNILDSVLLRRSLVGEDQSIEEACGVFGFTPFCSLATGQTTCWDSGGSVVECAGTGQDGDVQAGAALSYVDNGDGTITDRNTGLVWEKQSDDGTIHDKDNAYLWDDAFAVHVAGLNDPNAPFAGHTDWRVPNIKELFGLVDEGRLFPSIDPAFNTGCTGGCTVTTCSCMASLLYGASTSSAFAGNRGYGVSFRDGIVGFNLKSRDFSVRAVRGPRLPVGELCLAGTECASGFCRDGVCCDSVCSGICESCLTASTQSPDGTCAFVRGGTDPDAECVSPAVCGGGAVSGSCCTPTICGTTVGEECGFLYDDGCGVTRFCGCVNGLSCEGGFCEFGPL